MWTRRVDLNICEPLANGFRFSQGLRLFKDRIVTVPEAADGLKKMAQDRLAWLDGQLEGREFLCGKRFTLADILLYCFLDFGKRRRPAAGPGEQARGRLVRAGEGEAVQRGVGLHLHLVGRSKFRSAAKKFRVGGYLSACTGPTRKILRIFRPPHKGEVRMGAINHTPAILSPLAADMPNMAPWRGTISRAKSRRWR